MSKRTLQKLRTVEKDLTRLIGVLENIRKELNVEKEEKVDHLFNFIDDKFESSNNGDDFITTAVLVKFINSKFTDSRTSNRISRKFTDMGFFVETRFIKGIQRRGFCVKVIDTIDFLELKKLSE